MAAKTVEDQTTSGAEMDIIEAIKSRRSVRKFKNVDVPDELILKLIDSARWAPNACNKQLWKFVVIKDPTVRKEISTKVGSCMSYTEAPCLIGVFYHREFERISPLMDGLQSAAAAIQNILLTAHSLGLGGLWWCGISDLGKLREILNVPGEYRVVAMISIGYPEKVPSAPFRKSLDDIICWDRFSRGDANLSADPDDWTLREIADYRNRISRHTGEDSALEIFHPISSEFRTVVDFAAEFIGRLENPIVLDIHPYGGEFLDALSKRVPGANYIIYEMNDSLANLALSRVGTKARVVTSETHHIPLENDSVDVITCFYRLERIPNYPLLLSEIERILRPEGRFVVSFFNQASVIYWLSRLARYKSLLKLHLPRKKFLTEKANWKIGPQTAISRRSLAKSPNHFRLIKQIGVLPLSYHLCTRLLNRLSELNVSVMKSVIKTRSLAPVKSLGRQHAKGWHLWYLAHNGKLISGHVPLCKIAVVAYEKCRSRC